jgi:putative nucleotidyltransferase with HDIG domain
LDELPSRAQAWALLTEYTTEPGLLRHACAVEAALRAYARRFHADEHAWGLAGLLHDFDYQRWPRLEDHPWRGVEILAGLGYPAWFRRAILSHAPHTRVAPESGLEKALFACDELCGFLVACALVTPTRSLHDVGAASVRKKMKDKAFARGVHRDDIVAGAAGLGVSIDDHIAFVLDALGSIAPELGLAGGG